VNDNNPRFGGQNLPAGATSKLLPYAIALVGVVGGLLIVAFVAGFFNGSPSGSQQPGTSLQPSASNAASLAPATGSAATLEITSGPSDIVGSWTLDGVSGDVSPTVTIVAGVWTKTIDNIAAGYGDLITVSLGGPIAGGTRPTDENLKIGFSILRGGPDPSNPEEFKDIFDWNFNSEAGECQITMSPGGTTLSGTFTCSGLTGTNSVDGTTASATASGTFALE
jgi:hypothetical protein